MCSSPERAAPSAAGCSAADRCWARSDRHPQFPVECGAAAGAWREAGQARPARRARVREAVLEAEPDAIVHEATALADVKFRRNLDKVRETNELRTMGTDVLLAAAREAGVRRFVAQSVACFGRYAREGGPVKTEDDPLDPRRRGTLSEAPPRWPTSNGGHRLRRHRAALRRLLRGRQRRHDRACPQAPVPDRRRRRRHLVLDPPRRRCSGDGPRAGARWPGDLQHRRRRTCRGAGMAAGARPVPGREATATLPAWLARLLAVIPWSCVHRGARRLEREGQARARLVAALFQLAQGIPRRLFGNRRLRTTEAAGGPANKPLVGLERVNGERKRGAEGCPLAPFAFVV